MQKQLPPKYYLSHFNELLSFIERQCTHLLDGAKQAYITKLKSLDEASLCTLLRIYSRKPDIIALSSLNYEEIPQLHQALFTLKSKGLVAHPSTGQLDLVIDHLTKPELVALLSDDSIMQPLSAPLKKSAAKAQLITLCQTHIKRDSEAAALLCQQFVVNNKSEHYEYLVFLHSGRLSSGDINHQNRFVMRDLGIAKVRSDVTESKAQFTSLAQAQSHYELNLCKLAFKHSSEEAEYLALAQRLKTIICVDELGFELKNKLLLRLFKQFKNSDIEYALDLLDLCHESSEATEQAVRLRYKQGELDWVQNTLEQIINDPLDDSLLYFADDFLQRKFNKQLTSRLTQMLKDAAYQLPVDDIYRGDVEQGVSDLYQRQGYTVFYTENQLWLSLFALVFWQELYIDTPAPLCNEFDIYPPLLLQGRFYEVQAKQIEQKLTHLGEKHSLFALITKNAAQFYAQPNGFFYWHDELLEPLKVLIEHSELPLLKQHLLQMTKRFKELKDGYPDLMVIKNGQLYFDEVKAPGDKLRRNQLVTIDAMKQQGFLVNIVAVTWFNDPERIYSVIDLETTGSVSGNHKITEIGLVQLQAGEEINRWSSLINPMRPIPPFITKLTGISDHMVATAPTFAEVVDDFLAQIKGSVFVAHNVNFDYGFIKKECEQLGRVFKMPKLCTVVESRRAFAGLKSYSLGNLASHFELNLTSHHRALADASATAELLLLIQQQNAKKAT